jgi:hypothetical protein
MSVDPDWLPLPGPPREALQAWATDTTVFFPTAAYLDRWYKGEHFHVLPSKAELREQGLASVLEGWRPAAPIIGPHTRVLAMGSCFASYFILWLADHGFNQQAATSPYDQLLRCRSGLENAPVIAQQFRWAFGEMDPAGALWFDTDKQLVEATEERRQAVRQSLETAEVLILTLGLSELWYDRVTGEPLWRTIPLRHFDPARHTFRLLTVADTVAALEEIERVRARHVPRLKIVYTVSPVPLRATYRPVSAIVANAESKAVLRAALGQFLRERNGQLGQDYFYFPSYELVLHVFREPFEHDFRHVHRTVVDRVLALFARTYTTLPADADATGDGGEGIDTELYGRLDALEAQVSALQAECVAKQRVIEELDRAAQERLAVIAQLDAACTAYRQALAEGATSPAPNP